MLYKYNFFQKIIHFKKCKTLMENNEIVISGKGYNYLGEFLNDLPENVMLNKVTTGCGMTSVVLENMVKYVLAVPFKALIRNKVSWCNDKGIEVCPVYYGACDIDDVINFKGDKIITTYDSLGKVTEALSKRGDLKKWKICVDEAHKLVDSAAFRPDAIKTVLDNYTKYKSFVFGTATPIDDEYQLPALKSIKRVKIDWGDLEEVKVNFCQYEKNISEITAVIAIDFLTSVKTGNAHIFINSVSSICSIIRKIKSGGFDQSENIRIVCADNDRNINLIENKLSNDYFISEVGSDVKKVNFYTSTAFEGSDIYDEEGKNFIITDGSKDYTKVDIVTLLPQIIGRVRNSKYKSIVELLYTKNQYISDITEEEHKNRVLKNIQKAKQAIEEFNSLSPKSFIRESILKNNDNSFMIVNGNELLLNDSAWYNEMHNFSTLRKTYYVSKDGLNRGISDGTKTFNDIDYSYKGIEKVEIKGINKIKLGIKTLFKDLCKDYIESANKNESFILHIINSKEPIIREAYNVLGEDKMKTLRYRKKDFQKELLISSEGISNNYKIVKLLNLRSGDWLSKTSAKKKLQEVYDSLQIELKAKASDLEKWYSLINKNKRINGEYVNGLAVVTCNLRLV